MRFSIRNLAPSLTRARSLLGNIWAHDLAERMRIRRANLAKMSGLDDGWDVGTYPPFVTQRSGFLLGSVVTAGALALGAAGAWWLGDQWTGRETTVEHTIEREIGVGIEIIPPGESE